jgi:uncharacterized protein YjbI with pentapeptide repeats/uncharacterized membrane-anchored protein YhcB (DUF1043 family)
MDSAVEAAIIAASVSGLTLIGTLAAQFYGIHRTSKDTEKTLESQVDQLRTKLKEQREELDRQLTEQRDQLTETFAEQREQLNKTLKAQSDQLDKTLAEQRTRTLNERFATAADKLGSDKPPAVRLAGVYAMAGLADDWAENRQTCVDVLCAYLRLPHEDDPGDDTPAPERLAFRANREVRYTVIRVITEHLQVRALLKDDPASWQDLNFDFTGVVFDGPVNFHGAQFARGLVNFTDARFSDRVDFTGARFSGSVAQFTNAEFSGSLVDFGAAKFTGAWTFFNDVKFSGKEVDFGGIEFSEGPIDFSGAEFSGTYVYFNGAKFTGGRVNFSKAKFTGGRVGFGGTKFPDGVSVAQVNFRNAEFSGGEVSFRSAEFSGGADFSEVADWTHPPEFSWQGTPPTEVKLPAPASGAS